MKNQPRHIRQLIVLLIIAGNLAFAASMYRMLNPPPATAAYNPAPPHLVAAAKRRIPPPPGTTKKRAWIICQVFRGRYCPQALNVAWCESGLDPRARNGQHVGMWQMGSQERKRFGDGSNAWAQTIAAKRYFNIAGWGPWSCSPN